METQMAIENSAASQSAWSDDTGRHMRFRPDGSEWLDVTVERFATHLKGEGLRAALGYLNSQTRFRYTGAYRLTPPLLCSIEIFDRENPSVALFAEVEMQTTYCSIVGEVKRGLAVDDAALDDRVSTHPARERYAAYCGVPLRRRDGEPFGTLCHFDPRPRIGTAGQLELLERVAPLIADYVTTRAG